MSEILVDSNVILDILTEDPQWFDWSSQMLTDYANQGDLVINPIIYAEISIGFNQPEEVEDALPEDFFRRDPLPYSATFLAGQSFLAYRRHGGERRSPLPDFYIGAHAVIANMPLLTRDVNRYRTYFPSVQLILKNLLETLAFSDGRKAGQDVLLSLDKIGGGVWLLPPWGMVAPTPFRGKVCLANVNGRYFRSSTGLTL